MDSRYLKWVILIVLTLTWGSSFILIKQSLVSYTPYQVGALRLSVAGLILVGFGIRNFKYIPKKSLPWVIAGGAMGNFIPMFLFPMAQQYVSSSMAGILDSLVPIFIILLGFVFFGIKSRTQQIIGAIIGFIGAIILMGDDGQSGTNSLWGSGLIIFATALYAMNGLILNRYLSDIPSFKLSSVVFYLVGSSFNHISFKWLFRHFPRHSRAMGRLRLRFYFRYIWNRNCYDFILQTHTTHFGHFCFHDGLFNAYSSSNLGSFRWRSLNMDSCSGWSSDLSRRVFNTEKKY